MRSTTESVAETATWTATLSGTSPPNTKDFRIGHKQKKISCSSPVIEELIRDEFREMRWAWFGTNGGRHGGNWGSRDSLAVPRWLPR